MLKNAYFLAKIGADKAENEQQFAEMLPKIGNYPTGPVDEVATGADSTAEPASATTQVEDQWSAQRALLLSNSLTGAVGKCMFFCD